MSETTSTSAAGSGDSGDLLDPMGLAHAELPLSIAAGETPTGYSRRLYRYTNQHASLQGCTAALLARRDVPFLRAALSAYVGRFKFRAYPIDMALRLFLAWERLPSEAQQVDRILTAFAAAYVASNAEIMDEHQAYLLSFSIVLLHTSTFNPNVRAPMTKADFVGVAAPTELPRPVLEYVYDNVTLVEFAYMHDVTQSKRRTAVREQDAVYKLVVSGELVQLQLGLGPYGSALGSAAQCIEECDVEALHETVVYAPTLALHAPKQLDAQMRIVKIGAVARREKHAWRTWGVIVTGSTLVWFRDAATVQTLQAHIAQAQPPCNVPLVLEVDEVTPLAGGLLYECDGVLCLDHARRPLQFCPGANWPVWLTAINYSASLATLGFVWDDVVLPHVPWHGTLLPTPGPPLCVALTSSGAPSPAAAAEQALEQCTARRAALALESTQLLAHARHYALLTPLQRATRDRLAQARDALLDTLRTMHRELAVLACHIPVLATVASTTVH